MYKNSAAARGVLVSKLGVPLSFVAVASITALEVELLQRMPMDIRLAASAEARSLDGKDWGLGIASPAAKVARTDQVAKSKACLVDHLALSLAA